MGRTIPSFRLATVEEEKEWKQFRKQLINQTEKRRNYHAVSCTKDIKAHEKTALITNFLNMLDDIESELV